MLYGGTIFLAAFLLFLVEPMAAKQLLPAFGGSAAVWLTCLVFFQTALLAGYTYAHWAVRRAGQRGQMALHIALLLCAAVSAIVWSLRSGTFRHASSHPFAMIFLALVMSIGLPFVLLGSTSPLLQAWLARLEHGRIPFRLFALSNLASLLALALYPTLVEPYLTLHMQRVLWSCGFVCFAALAATLVRGVRRGAATPPDSSERDEALSQALPEDEAPASRRSRWLWLLLPLVASMQLCAVTSYLTANIAAIPLLWILPLAAYLVTLIVAFEYARFVPRPLLTRLLVVILAGLAYMMAKADVSLPWV